MFDEIIEKLLNLKANLNFEKEKKLAEVIQSTENEFNEKSIKIDNMLNQCGYVAPIENACQEIDTNYNEAL